MICGSWVLTIARIALLIDFDFLLFYVIYIYIYIVELNVEPHTNLIGKFEFKSNLIVSELEFEPEPCDIASNNALCN